MVKATAIISESFKLRQRLLDNKPFLVEIGKAKRKKTLEKLIKQANSSELDILRDLLKNISEKNIEISKSVLNTKKKFDNVVSLIASYQRTPSIHKSQSSLQRFLLKFIHVLPVIAKTVLK